MEAQEQAAAAALVDLPKVGLLHLTLQLLAQVTDKHNIVFCLLAKVALVAMVVMVQTIIQLQAVLENLVLLAVAEALVVETLLLAEQAAA